MQAHRAEPRTTLDIDLGVLSLDALPRDALRNAGFEPAGRFARSENWLGPGGAPVQFSDDPALAPAIARAVELEGVSLRVLSAPDLLHQRLLAGAAPNPRRSKRLQCLADAEGLLEEIPELRAELTEDEQRILGSLPD